MDQNPSLYALALLGAIMWNAPRLRNPEETQSLRVFDFPRRSQEFLCPPRFSASLIIAISTGRTIHKFAAWKVKVRDCHHAISMSNASNSSTVRCTDLIVSTAGSSFLIRWLHDEKVVLSETKCRTKNDANETAGDFHLRTEASAKQRTARRHKFQPLMNAKKLE